MVVGTDKEILAIIAVADEVHESSKEVIQNYINLASKIQLCLPVIIKVLRMPLEVMSE